MASGFHNFLMNLLLNRLLQGTAGTFPPTVYFGLYSATPNDTTAGGGGTEITTGVIGGYARVSKVTTSAQFTTSSAGSSSNVTIIDFGTASAGSGVSVTQWGMFDGPTAGNLLCWADLTPAQTVANGNPYSFAVGALVIAGI